MNEVLTKDAIPVTVLTGFLGSGKTTLLNRILSADHGLRVAVLVNDFGAINVDAELVIGVEDDMISLANGCVCCQVRDDLIEAIDAVIERPTPVDYILLEASGVAEPGGIFATFTDKKYGNRIRVDSITCVIDAEQILDEQDSEPLSLLKLRQIGFADLLILNKTDLVDVERIAELRAWIDAHLNRVRIVEAIHGNAPLDVLLGAGRFDMAKQVFANQEGENQSSGAAHGQDHAQEFSTWSFETSKPMSLDSLRKMVKRQLPREVYRCKGIIHTHEHPAQRCILQVVGRRAEVIVDRPWNGEKPVTRIVAIASGSRIDGRALESLFENCIHGQEPAHTEKLPGVRTVRI